MRGWALDATGEDAAASLRDVPEPELGPWDVRVTLRASGLNHLDRWVARGMPAPPAFPHVVGADGAGVVAEVGQAVDDVRVGSEVVVDPAVSCGRCLRISCSGHPSILDSACHSAPTASGSSRR